MNREELMQILPHRDVMLLLDEAEVIDGVAHGKLKITGDEWFLKGHFPEEPIVPGVIQCEILAQSTCVLLQDAIADSPNGVRTLYTGLNNVKFRKPVRPGDEFRTECVIVKQKAPFYFASGKGYVGDTLCISAEFSFAVQKL
ncbi:MAG: beta-hydroxyacyl-ACP dehydratase [Oscillospiraceae bacterium]|nr:beta-hydroxyacyl-ACP dehydratase [Ruminococcus sp.]MBQ4346217.1 beta-hydroxyacyl-ACP dehydratase [Oscillospiraceae bacterium]